MSATRPRARWIVFDVGETLIDESRMWNEWADIVGVPRFTFAAALGAVIARGEDHRRVFDVVASGVDWRALLVERGVLSPARIDDADLYPDVRTGLSAIRAAGFMVGIAGNQPVATELSLERLGIPFDLVASSETFGATKPDPLFFERLVAATGEPASDVAYVGDRIDNDVVPARAGGLQAVLLKRGPWASIGSIPTGTLVVDSIPGLLDIFELSPTLAPARVDA